MRTYDVLIIGAGPAGCMAAYTLAKNNISVAVLEQKKEIGLPVCCGEAISEAALIQSGIFDNSYVDQKVKGFRVYFPNMKYFYVDMPGFLIDRDKFDKYIAALAQKSGAEIFLSSRAADIKPQNGYFEALSGGKTFRSKILIGADGPDSTVEKIFFNNKFLLTPALQYKLDKSTLDFDSGGYLAFYYDSLSDYYMWAFEKSTELNVGGGVYLKEKLDAFIKTRFNLDNFKYLHFSRGLIPVSGIKQKIYKEKIFLIGDAAGVVNPASLAGIYAGLISAKEAAAAIIKYFDSGKESALDGYEENLRKYAFVKKFLLNTAKKCYRHPEKVLNFLGDYFISDNFSKKDYAGFLNLALKNPYIFKYLSPLIAHRQLLKYHGNELW